MTPDFGNLLTMQDLADILAWMNTFEWQSATLLETPFILPVQIEHATRGRGIDNRSGILYSDYASSSFPHTLDTLEIF